MAESMSEEGERRGRAARMGKGADGEDGVEEEERKSGKRRRRRRSRRRRRRRRTRSCGNKDRGGGGGEDRAQHEDRGEGWNYPHENVNRQNPIPYLLVAVVPRLRFLF